LANAYLRLAIQAERNAALVVDARLVSGEISMLKPVSGSKNDSQRD
jgi:hypothetical protein